MSDKPSAAGPGLVRALGPAMAVAVVVGTVIGSGIFKKPQEVALNTPFFGLAALLWVLGGVLALLGGLALAEVAVLYPRAGGNYVFLREGYGRLAGFLYAWVDFLIVRGASIAALATIFAESLHDILRNVHFETEAGSTLVGLLAGFWARKWLTIAVIATLGLVNVRGVRWGGGLQLLITLVKIGSLLGIMVLPLLILMRCGSGPPDPTGAPRTDNLLPAWPSWDQVRLGAVGTALLGVLWAYHGWMNIAPVAEEVRHPQRNIPLALLGGQGIIIVLYLGANLAYYLVIPQPEMAGLKDTTVATDFSRRLLGPVGATVASAAVMCSVFGALNGNLLVGPRVLYALGEDGLAPRSLGKVHPRFHTPARAILVMAVWASLLVVAASALSQVRLPVLNVAGWKLDLNVPQNKSLFDILTDFAMFGAVIFETLAVTTIFVFRRRLPDAKRPYRCIGYPIVPAVYVLVLTGVLCNMFMNQQAEAVAGMAFIGAGAATYGWLTRWR